MALAGIGLYLFFKKKSATAPVVPPTTGGGSELLPIAPTPVYDAPVQPIYVPSEPVYITPTQPVEQSPISALAVLTNPISEIISLVPVQQYPSEPIYQAPAPTPAPIYEAPVQPSPAPVYNEPTPPPMEYYPIYEPTPVYQPEPTPVYYEPSPVFSQPTPVYQPEPINILIPPQIPVDEPLPPSAYLEEYQSITNPYGYQAPSNFIPEQIGTGGLFDFISNQLWLGNLTSFQAESYMAVDTTTKDQSDQA